MSTSTPSLTPSRPDERVSPGIGRSPAAAGIASDRDPTRPASILIVDDEATVAMILARGLQYAGYETSIARSGPEALDHLAERHFDLLLTDLQMPKMRGDELQRIARERDPD